MLQKKDKRELIRSYADRKSELTTFLSTHASSSPVIVASPPLFKSMSTPFTMCVVLPLNAQTLRESW